MITWMKSIGSADRPITDPPHNGNWKGEAIGFRRDQTPGVRKGDHLILYAPGGSKKIFGLAEVTTDPVPDPNYNRHEHGATPWKVSLAYPRGIIMPVAHGVSIDDVKLSRDLTLSIRRRSHIKLKTEEYEKILGMLIEKLENK